MKKTATILLVLFVFIGLGLFLNSCHEETPIVEIHEQEEPKKNKSIVKETINPDGSSISIVEKKDIPMTMAILEDLENNHQDWKLIKAQRIVGGILIALENKKKDIMIERLTSTSKHVRLFSGEDKIKLIAFEQNLLDVAISDWMRADKCFISKEDSVQRNEIETRF